MYIKVNLSRRNIREAVKSDCADCVLAKKASTLVKKEYLVTIGVNTLYIKKRLHSIYGPPIYSATLSKQNQKIVEKFDDNKLKSCSTYLSIPKQYLKPSVVNS